MKLKKIFAVVLAAALAGAFSLTAMAAAGGVGLKAGPIRDAWAEKNFEPFKKLLEDGIVSQDSYDKMTEYLKENVLQKAGLAEQRMERANILDKLLSEKVITQAEYDAIKAVVPTLGDFSAERPAPEKRPAFPDDPKRGNFLGKLVEDGVISQQTADAITEYRKSSISENISIKERADIFSRMLESGVITQAEYNAIKAALTERAASLRRSGAAAKAK